MTPSEHRNMVTQFVHDGDGDGDVRNLKLSVGRPREVEEAQCGAFLSKIFEPTANSLRVHTLSKPGCVRYESK